MFSLISQASKTEDIRDIVEIAPEASMWPIIFWAAIALSIVGLILWLILFLVRRGKKRAFEAAPHAVALRSLHRLEAALSGMEPNAFGLEVSETLKNFLSAKFNDPIRYETAEEFLHRFANSSIPVTHLPTAVHQNLRTFVSTSEEIKFGKAPDARGKMKPLLTLATTIVNLIQTINQAEKEKQADSII